MRPDEELNENLQKYKNRVVYFKRYNKAEGGISTRASYTEDFLSRDLLVMTVSKGLLVFRKLQSYFASKGKEIVFLCTRFLKSCCIKYWFTVYIL